MEYNKNYYHKTNDKKILHKVKKHWVTISIAMLSMLTGGAVATHVSANANAASQNNDQVNHSLTFDQGQNLTDSLVNDQSNHSSRYFQNYQNSNDVSNQASTLHDQIIKGYNSNDNLNHHREATMSEQKSSSANNSQPKLIKIKPVVTGAVNDQVHDNAQSISSKASAAQGISYRASRVHASVRGSISSYDTQLQNLNTVAQSAYRGYSSDSVVLQSYKSQAASESILGSESDKDLATVDFASLNSVGSRMNSAMNLANSYATDANNVNQQISPFIHQIDSVTSSVDYDYQVIQSLGSSLTDLKPKSNSLSFSSSFVASANNTISIIDDNTHRVASQAASINDRASSIQTIASYASADQNLNSVVNSEGNHYSSLENLAKSYSAAGSSADGVSKSAESLLVSLHSQSSNSANLASESLAQSIANDVGIRAVMDATSAESERDLVSSVGSEVLDNIGIASENYQKADQLLSTVKPSSEVTCNVQVPIYINGHAAGMQLVSVRGSNGSVIDLTSQMARDKKDYSKSVTGKIIINHDRGQVDGRFNYTGRLEQLSVSVPVLIDNVRSNSQLITVIGRVGTSVELTDNMPENKKGYNKSVTGAIDIRANGTYRLSPGSFIRYNHITKYDLYKSTISSAASVANSMASNFNDYGPRLTDLANTINNDYDEASLAANQISFDHENILNDSQAKSIANSAAGHVSYDINLLKNYDAFLTSASTRISNDNDVLTSDIMSINSDASDKDATNFASLADNASSIATNVNVTTSNIGSVYNQVANLSDKATSVESNVTNNLSSADSAGSDANSSEVSGAFNSVSASVNSASNDQAYNQSLSNEQAQLSSNANVIGQDVTKVGSLAHHGFNEGTQLASIVVNSYADNYTDLSHQLSSEGSVYRDAKLAVASDSALAHVEDSLGFRVDPLINSLSSTIKLTSDPLTQMSAQYALNSMNGMVQQASASANNDRNNASVNKSIAASISNQIDLTSSAMTSNYAQISNWSTSGMNSTADNTVNIDSRASEFASEAQANDSRTASLASSVAQNASRLVSSANQAKSEAMNAASSASNVAILTRNSIASVSDSINSNNSKASILLSTEISSASLALHSENYSEFINNENSMMSFMTTGAISDATLISRLLSIASNSQADTNVSNISHDQILVSSVGSEFVSLSNDNEHNTPLKGTLGAVDEASSMSPAEMVSTIDSDSNNADHYYQQTKRVLSFALKLNASHATSSAVNSAETMLSKAQVASNNADNVSTSVSSSVRAIDQASSVAAREASTVNKFSESVASSANSTSVANTIRNDINTINSYDQVAKSYDQMATQKLNSLDVNSNNSLASLKNVDSSEINDDENLIHEDSELVNSLNGNLSSALINRDSIVATANNQIAAASKVTQDASMIVADDITTLESKASQINTRNNNSSSNNSSADNEINSLALDNITRDMVQANNDLNQIQYDMFDPTVDSTGKAVLNSDAEQASNAINFIKNDQMYPGLYTESNADQELSYINAEASNASNVLSTNRINNSNSPSNPNSSSNSNTSNISNSINPSSNSSNPNSSISQNNRDNQASSFDDDNGSTNNSGHETNSDVDSDGDNNVSGHNNDVDNDNNNGTATFNSTNSTGSDDSANTVSGSSGNNSHNQSDQLPQTGELSNHDEIIAAVLLALGNLSMLVDLKRRHDS